MFDINAMGLHVGNPVVVYCKWKGNHRIPVRIRCNVAVHKSVQEKEKK